MRQFLMWLSAGILLAACSGGGSGGDGGSGGTPATDLQPPQISNRAPAPGAVQIVPTAAIVVTFNETIDGSQVQAALRVAGQDVALQWQINGAVLSLQPQDADQLSGAAVFTLSGVRDRAGNVMPAAEWSWTLQTIEPAFGLAQRPDNTSCVAPASAGGSSSLAVAKAFPQLPFMGGLLGLYQAPGDNARFYAVIQSGRILRFQNSVNVSQTETVLDIGNRVNSSNESGLLGIAFHPNFASNGFLYVNYVANAPFASRVSRFTVRPDGSGFDPASEQVLLEVPATATHHKAGQIAFGPDGYLYTSFGDDESPANGQLTSTLHGKVIRINVNAGAPYTIPADNPFVNGGGRPEIFAYGFRNPWRFSFDRVTGTFWVADVGETQWEEIDQVTRGGNYGWSELEGDHCRNASSCNRTGKQAPVFEYSHEQGCSIIGGAVYRGSALAALRGTYVYSDYCAGHVWGLNRTGSDYQQTDFGDMHLQPVAIAEDNAGELYLLQIWQGGTGGQIYKIVAGSGPTSSTIPTRLSATGCVAADAPQQPAAGLLPYTVNSPLWSDGASKQRYMALPNTSTMAVDSVGDLSLPVGTILMKNFSLDNRLVETRLLMHHQDGWSGYSYEWRDDQSDADLLATGKDKVVGTITWHFPSREECSQCHTAASGNALSPETRQLNRDYHYTASNVTDNQLRTLEHIGVFSTPLSVSQRSEKFADLSDSSTTLAERARSYLHSNCSHCHRPGGNTPVQLDFRYETPLAQTQVCDQPPALGSLGLADARLLAVGAPERSVLLARMRALDANRMPPLGSHVVDQQAITVLTDWIRSLNNCASAL
ncbi:hypothetical protein HPT27_06035 [Permianibacter sp. IMCC34836]|uniref:PQQ-dependent sugar dehydrogenase n=1 Tax=Permianibacter fluminis TaxID=2738515 RepID=UPI0015552569|nr:PQQ-dependent sugar dehydrogenase [Permianibacter fluminis]NQD36576.1 hypothetical protein [Permianibacter fluminis]